MKFQILILTIFVAVSTSFAQKNNSKNAVTNVFHNMNNISLNTLDGNSATINVNGNSATLTNSDGTHSTINFSSTTSNLVAIDGSLSTIFHHGSSSIIRDSDGTSFNINHKRSTSSCTTSEGIHVITHNFGNIKERRNKDKIDILIHKNWLVQKKAEEARLSTTEKVLD